MIDVGKMLMLLGGVLMLVGVLIYFGDRLPWFGSLPGDVVMERDNFTLYAPIGSMILISILLTIVLNLIGRFLR